MRTAIQRGVLGTATAGAMTALLIAGTQPAQAGGFALRVGSADWMANAFAGATAKGYDASTVWSNPAGMVRLNQNEIDGSLNGIFPSINFSGSAVDRFGAPVAGTTGGNLIQSAATGGVYAVWNLSPDFKLGFGADAPFGQRVANPGNFVGRYQSLVSSITDEAFTISAAYKINQQWSIGGGPVIDVFSARLTQAVQPFLPGLNALGDPVADLHGQDVGAGFNLGVMYQATPDLRFGLDYRSRIQHNISGTQSVFVPPALGFLSPLLAAQNSPASTKITLPDSASLGAYWQATPQLALLADIVWTNWSLLKNIVIVPTSPLASGSTIAENWRDTVGIFTGANYQATRTLMLQGGAGFDQSPVTDNNRTSRIPDANHFVIGLGAQYEVTPAITLQMAYAHVFVPSAPIQSGGITGTYSDAANTGSLGVKIRF
jgi:long-chain fatty acid transport protein